MDRDHIDAVNDAWTRELPGLVNDHSVLAKRITSLSAGITRAISAAVNAHGLTLAEYDILVALRRQGVPYCLSPVEISRELLLSSGGTSNALKRLRERCLLDVNVSRTDRRSRSVALTSAGVELTEVALRDSVAAQTGLLSRVPRPLARQTATALRDIAATLPTRATATIQ